MSSSKLSIYCFPHCTIHLNYLYTLKHQRRFFGGISPSHENKSPSPKNPHPQKIPGIKIPKKFLTGDFWGSEIPYPHPRDFKSPGIFWSSPKWKIIPKKSHPKATSAYTLSKPESYESKLLILKIVSLWQTLVKRHNVPVDTSKSISIYWKAFSTYSNITIISTGSPGSTWYYQNF